MAVRTPTPAVPRNNLKEQLALHNKKRAASENGNRPLENRQHFKKLNHSYPCLSLTETPSKPVSSAKNGTTSNYGSKNHSSTSVTPSRNSHSFPQQQQKPRIAPPVAFVTPVMSKGTPSAAPSLSYSKSSPVVNTPGSSLASCRAVSSFSNIGSSLTSYRTVGSNNSTRDSSAVENSSQGQNKVLLQKEIDDVRSERLTIMDGICELLADIPSSEITSFFGLSAGHLQKQLAMRKKLILKEKELRKCLDEVSYLQPPSQPFPQTPVPPSPNVSQCIGGPPRDTSSVSAPAASSLGMEDDWDFDTEGMFEPMEFTGKNWSHSTLDPTNRRESLDSHTKSNAPISTSSLNQERLQPVARPNAPEDWDQDDMFQPQSVDDWDYNPPSLTSALRTSTVVQPTPVPAAPGPIDRNQEDKPWPPPKSTSHWNQNTFAAAASKPTATAPQPTSGWDKENKAWLPPRSTQNAASKLTATTPQPTNDWDNDEEDDMIDLTEVPLEPEPCSSRPGGGVALSETNTASKPSQSVVTHGSISRSSFKPPFLQTGSGRGNLDASFAVRSGKPSMFKPTKTGNELPQDNAPEFRGQYSHTRELYKIFNQVFGLKRFRPNQLEAINAVILRKDCFVLMPTGGGKSLCYQLPALIIPGVTIVVSPLRSLIQDQVQKLTSLGIPAKHLSSDLSVAEENEVYASLTLREPVTRLLYVTPEKLGASNKLVSTLTGLHNRQMLARFVIDEAHCISQWGHDFRPDYKKLSQLRRKFFGVPIVALTATATPRVRADILHQLNMERTCKWFTQSFNRTNLKYSVVPKKPKKVFQDIIELISKSFPDQSGIVYCLSRRDTELMAGELCKANLAALCYHAGLSDDQRSMVQQRWVQEDRCKIVCATIAFGMGIDKPDVRFVIHHSLPKSVEGYYQEAGRAGRDGLPAECILFYTYADMGRLRRMVKAEKLRYDQEKVHMDNLYRMVQYCENMSDCRRVQLLEYFAENFDPSFCKNGSTPCDNCQSNVPFISEDVTDLAKVIVQSVKAVGTEKYTLNQYLEALKGTARASAELKLLPLYNHGGSKSKHDLERLLHMLVMKDILAETITIGNHDNVVCYVKAGSRAMDVLGGRITGIILKLKGGSASSSTTKTTAKTVSKNESLKNECYKALSMLRLSVTTKLNMKNPEYIISTASLQAMSELLPTTKEELLSIEGYTEVKWDKFNGEEFLKVTKEYADEVAMTALFEKGSGGGCGEGKKSAYFNKGSKAQQKPPVVLASRGKRKKADSGSSSSKPKAKRPAVLNLPREHDSEDEFEQPTTTNNKWTLKPLPHPNR